MKAHTSQSHYADKPFDYIKQLNSEIVFAVQYVTDLLSKWDR
jgi:hypothetical protein